MEGLRGLSPRVGGAPVLELCWDAEARGGARDEGAWGGHGVPQGVLEAGDADVEERQGALGSVDLGAVRHPRGEGVAPLDVQACHGPLDTVAEGARQGMRLTGKKKEIKEIKLNWTNPISRYISFHFYSHSYHVQLKAINSLESQKETEPIYSLFCTFCVKLIILCKELSLTVGDWRLSRVAPLCCLIVKTLSSPRTQTIGSKLYIQTFNRPHFHPGPVFYVPRTISDQHTEKLLQDI